MTGGRRSRGTLRRVLLGVAVLVTPLGGACDEKGPKNELAAMKIARLTIRDHAFEAWLATTPSEQQTGLMNVSDAELAPTPQGADRGMLFVFPNERILGFWMHNTIIPLDIAYARSDGTIVTLHTMAPHDTRIYSSFQPARFALEVRAGRFKELSIVEGDRIEIPESVLKAAAP